MADFNQIIGHEQIIEHLKNAISMQKVSHAYLIEGAEKSGKKLLADAFAKTLQCEEGGTQSCGRCHSCIQAESHSQPDIIYVRHEKTNTISVDDIREQVNADIVIKPYSSRYKIYVIDEAHKMNTQAQNALLKTIEEPPHYAVILLLTTNAQALLPTIQSRCVTLSLRPVADEVIRQHLIAQYGLSSYDAQLCTAFAQGSVGKAQMLAASENFATIKEEAIQLIKRLSDIDAYEMAEAVRHINEYEMSVEEYLDILLIWYRDVLMFKACQDINQLIFQDEAMEIKRQAEKGSYAGINEIITSIEKAKIRLRANVNYELTMELLLLTIKENQR
jgi:DNA polymerase-3 subunit delta'